MFLKKIHIHNYKIFNDIEVNINKSDISNVFSLASINGGGKSTLLQFIFIMLNCFMDENKKRYIVNLLEDIKFTDEEKNNLIDFVIHHKDKDYNLEFLIVSHEFENMEFNLYSKEKILKSELKRIRIRLRRINDKLETSRYKYEKKVQFDESSIGRILGDNGDNSISRKKELQKKQDLLKSELYLNTHLLENLQLDLKKINLKYIINIDDNHILLLKTNMTDELLIDLSKKVFLASPSSQIFHFFSQKIQNAIFKYTKNQLPAKSYSEIIEDSKNDIENFFTYDFFSTDIILEAFEKAFKKDRKLKVSDGIYGNHFDDLSNIFENFLEGKTISVDEDFSRVIYKFKNTNQELSPVDLSHGELKRLSIFIWLKYLVEEDSIVLMDEIDIALHPSWQYDLVDDLQEWSKNTQFFLATHSPQILSSTYHKNLILLEKKDNKSILHPKLNKPLDNNDINTVIDLIMGTNHLPKKLDKWHIEYRNLVKEGKEKSDDAKKIKNKILDWESINSSFFRQIEFFKKMKK